MPAGVSTGPVTDFAAVLGAERSRAEHRLVSLRAELASVIEGSRFTTDDDEHDPEGSTIAFERAKIAALITDTESEIREIDAAVSRLSAGTYGTCERCGGEIPAIRLEALPAARRCMQCVRLR
ncbi:dksa/trar family transcriptional regulator [Rhodococcus sp. 05-340-1]|uniref:TraR/DksA family transcriptional regulator n=1 Tax=Nocardiaceae TaxID=85025 RepID=UPI0006898958|nr:MULTISPECIES: TraR/DksA C4-type zinc finger protein [Rhodococcus]OZD68831.1 dksa/trar family transcriptional regulator [Rhodococcus sp. 05-340-2]OZD70410.1 dksa/trar family transcriptional regulator [Rhodococcus sp. 05-340-1]OZE93928.1 dksa/trar family transcriptional regulator [Rhodococcus sp. 15-2388-1-1a]